MPSNMYRRMLAKPDEMFNYRDGPLKVFGIYSRIFPIVSLVLLERLFEENLPPKKVHDLLYLVGETQSYHATSWTVKKVGIPLKGNELRILQETTGHGEVTGIGATKIIKFDLKNRSLILSKKGNVFCEQYRRMYGDSPEGADHYVRGLVGGVAKFLFGEDMAVVMTQCVTSGKSCCMYHAMPPAAAIQKYGKKAKKFLPSPDLKTRSVAAFDLRKLVH